MPIHEELRRKLLVFQRNEITEHEVYARLARRAVSPGNREVLERIAADEKRHHDEWKEHTGEDVGPDRARIWVYTALARLLGLTFAVKLMELQEERAKLRYGDLRGQIERAEAMAREEEQHEKALLGMIDEERLRYAGSIVLGLNDALVELTGALAGLTLALQNTRLISLTGLVTGIAAALSMASSEYLSTRSEGSGRQPLRAALYTGVAYIATVAILIAPYLVLRNYYLCLAVTLVAAIGIIAAFNFYIAVARGEPFRRRFLEMAALSLGVAALSFVLGRLIRAALGVEIG